MTEISFFWVNRHFKKTKIKNSRQQNTVYLNSLYFIENWGDYYRAIDILPLKLSCLLYFRVKPSFSLFPWLNSVGSRRVTPEWRASPTLSFRPREGSARQGVIRAVLRSVTASPLEVAAVSLQGQRGVWSDVGRLSLHRPLWLSCGEERHVGYPPSIKTSAGSFWVASLLSLIRWIKDTVTLKGQSCLDAVSRKICCCVQNIHEVKNAENISPT